ncbi:MAG: DNA polymerase III subunit alpha, partial [Clostridia bacterium]|nr:DNA polymerase III subunit alpha [Clostridia bacterium]
VNREDAFLQDVLTCIQTGKKLNDPDRLKFEGSEFYLKSEEEMAQLFAQYPDAISNTKKIAEQCNVELDFDTMHLPKAEIDADMPHLDYLKRLCAQGARAKYGEITPQLAERLRYELDIIEKMGYTDYFLIVWDFIRYAKTNGIMVGPGRGSAAGSLVAYCLDITEIDPIRYDLIFERFLNPERVSMPDIDVDFCYRRRDEVKEYVSKKYGYDRVSQIITFGTLAARAAIRDVGRVMDIEPYVVDKVAKSVPEVLHIKLKDAIETDADLKSMYNTDMKIKKLLDTAMALEGFPRNASTHAAGVVIADKPLNNYVPLATADTGILTQYPMGNLENMGILKMDFLGLRNLTVIRDTIELVRRYKGVEIDLKKLDYEDKATFNMIMSGDTDGVFQLENPGLQSFMQKFRPSCLEDIITTTSIYRPGPMEQIPQFLENVKNPDGIKYMHLKLEPILKQTYGAIIYQEQVMEIVRSLGGYSFGRADLVRRAMAKKKHSVMEQEREIFIHGLVEDGKVIVPGCVRNGVDEKCANDIFDYLIHFANYAFNKSHAACYATVAYQTAYLKCHYPTEYLVALLVSLMGNSHKTNKYLKSFAKYGIRLLPPDVNKSGAEFAVEGNDVRFGLSAIKNVGMQFPKDMEKERNDNGDFASFADFILRMGKYDTNRRTVETMIKTGVFDSLYTNRKSLCLSFERMMDIADDEARHAMAGQISLFDSEDSAPAVIDSMIAANVEDFTLPQKLNYEKELAGMYLFSHPLDPYLLKAKVY